MQKLIYEVEYDREPDFKYLEEIKGNWILDFKYESRFHFFGYLIEDITAELCEDENGLACYKGLITLNFSKSVEEESTRRVFSSEIFGEYTNMKGELAHKPCLLREFKVINYKKISEGRFRRFEKRFANTFFKRRDKLKRKDMIREKLYSRMDNLYYE